MAKKTSAKTARAKKSGRKVQSQQTIAGTGAAKNKAIELHAHVIADIKMEESDLKKEREKWQEDLTKLLRKQRRKSYQDPNWGLYVTATTTKKETVSVKRTYDQRTDKEKASATKAREANSVSDQT